MNVVGSIYLTIIPQTGAGYELLDNGGAGYHNLIISYPTSVIGIIVLFCFSVLRHFKHRDIILLLTVSKAEFCGYFPYLDELQDIGLISWVQSKV